MVVAYAKRLRFWTSIGSKKWFWTQNARMFDALLLCEPNFWILPGNNIYSMRSADWVQLRAMYAVLSDVQFWTAISSVDTLQRHTVPLQRLLYQALIGNSHPDPSHRSALSAGSSP